MDFMAHRTIGDLSQPLSARDLFSLLARTLGRLIAPFLLTLAFALWPHLARAAMITVDGTTCTLPDAINAANTDRAIGSCPAGLGGDTLLLTAPLVDSQLLSNTAPYAGGGIYNHDTGTVNVANVIFSNNVAGFEGGGFANRGTTILTNTVFISNAAGDGGGFSNYRGQVRVALARRD
jgi:hypothetical protein